MRVFIGVMFILSVLFISCGEGHEHGHTEDQDHASHALPAHEGELRLALNDGDKWKMDDHTRAMFVVMEDRVQSGGAVKEVGARLAEDVDQLIEGCTMTGAAHGQLHLFLGAYVPAVNAMQEHGSEEAYAEVKALLDTYPDYFE